jgi:hypothetical protein
MSEYTYAKFTKEFDKVFKLEEMVGQAYQISEISNEMLVTLPSESGKKSNLKFGIRTGFQDINKKDIYTNDIVKIDNVEYDVLICPLKGQFVVDSDEGRVALCDIYTECELVFNSTKLYCDKCVYLTLTEEEQNMEENKLKDHKCARNGERLMHYDCHPHIVRPSNCNNYEEA